MVVTRKSPLFAAVLAAGLVAAANTTVAAAQTAPWSAARISSLALGARPLADHPLPERVSLTPTFSALFGLFCSDAANCWAVGERGNLNMTLNLIQHWNGKSWRRVSAPSPAGSHMGDVSELNAVRCLTARDCWAIGSYSKGVADFAQALHWNGRKWSVTVTPQPGGTGNGQTTDLLDSSCTSAKSCWAVGNFGSRFGKRVNLLLHWNGKRWSRQSVVNPAGANATHLNTLNGIRCLSARNCIADGYYGTLPSTTGTDVILNQVLHWNGKRWSQEKTPNPGGTQIGKQNVLNGLACGTSHSCWGAGYYGTDGPVQTLLNQILHWNGKTWANVSTPNPAGTSSGSLNALIATACGSANNCWAVGEYRSSTDAFLNEAVRWNGKKWSLVPVPNPAGTGTGDQNTLEAVRCTSQNNCWAVGEVQPNGKALQSEILHWNGKKWSVH